MMERKAKEALRKSRAVLHSKAFKERHRTEKKYFSRARVLTFPIVLMLLLQKSVKSMQLVVNEFFEKTNFLTVSSSALTQARYV